jgi:hypothetical protein
MASISADLSRMFGGGCSKCRKPILDEEEFFIMGKFSWTHQSILVSFECYDCATASSSYSN